MCLFVLPNSKSLVQVRSSWPSAAGQQDWLPDALMRGPLTQCPSTKFSKAVGACRSDHGQIKGALQGEEGQVS